MTSVASGRLQEDLFRLQEDFRKTSSGRLQDDSEHSESIKQAFREQSDFVILSETNILCLVFSKRKDGAKITWHPHIQLYFGILVNFN